MRAIVLRECLVAKYMMIKQIFMACVRKLFTNHNEVEIIQQTIMAIIAKCNINYYIVNQDVSLSVIIHIFIVKISQSNII